MDSKRIASLYEALPALGPTQVVLAQLLLKEYVRSEFATIHQEGWRVLPGGPEPPDLAEVGRTRTLPVYDADHDGHPFFSPGVNYMFRAVHDIRGHFGGKVVAPFGFAGEIDAWRNQDASLRLWARRQDEPIGARTLREAREVLLSEIVGQAAYFDIHGRFPGQKVVLLPLSVLEGCE